MANQLERVKQAFAQLKQEVLQFDVTQGDRPGALSAVAILGGVGLLILWACLVAYG